MPYGTGAPTLKIIPDEDFVIAPGMFFERTRKNVFNLDVIPAPGGGQSARRTIRQTGIVPKLRITFQGTLTVSTAAVTTSDRWPHGLLDLIRLTVNGQNDLFNVSGEDLHVLRFARFPAFEDASDTFAGTVGGGNSVGVGATALHITWELPIAIDETSMAASLYAQSAATNIQLQLVQATNSQLFSANPANAAITGTFTVQQVAYEVPYDDEGKLVLPDLTRLHAVVATAVPFTAIGESRAALIRADGQLMRAFFASRSSSTNRLSAHPTAAATKKLDRLRLEYGGNQKPLDYDPASALLAENNQHYGAPLPYDRLALDLVKENPPRDTIIMQGVTELALVPTVNSGVTVSAGEHRVVQEHLF